MHIYFERGRFGIDRPPQFPAYSSASAVLRRLALEGSIVGDFDATVDDFDVTKRWLTVVVCRSVRVKAPEWTTWFEAKAPPGRPYCYEMAVEPARVHPEQMVNAIIDLLVRTP